MASRSIFNADLVDDVAQRRIVVFVGAGASRWARPKNGGEFRDWEGFLTYANSRVRSRRVKRVIADEIRNKDYLLASELLKNNLDDRWIQLLEDEFQKAADASRLHKAIASLDPRIIITTNFDKLLEAAFSVQDQKMYPKVLSKIDAAAFRIFRSDFRFIVKIHGSIDDPSEIVFDRSSYQKGAIGNQFYADFISTLLLTHTFVFVGFSMTDPAITTIVESSAFKYPNTRPHYIFQAGRAIREIDDLWKSLRKLYVIRYSPDNNHIGLAQIIEVLADAARRRRAEVFSEMSGD